MFPKSSQKAVRFASIGHHRRGRCRRAGESQLFYLTRQSPPACSSSIPGRSMRPSCISFSFRHRHASPPPLPRGAPAVWVSSSAHRGASDVRLLTTTTRTASGLLCTHNADAPCLPVGVLGSSIHLQEKIMTYYILSLI